MIFVWSLFFQLGEEGKPLAAPSVAQTNPATGPLHSRYVVAIDWPVCARQLALDLKYRAFFVIWARFWEFLLIVLLFFVIKFNYLISRSSAAAARLGELSAHEVAQPAAPRDPPTSPIQMMNQVGDAYFAPFSLFCEL